MADSPAPTPFPGPAALGRNVIVGGGAPAPDGFPADAPRLVVDDTVLAHPGPAVAFLHGRWTRRQPTVIELVADNTELQRPEVDDRAPWDLPRGFTFLRERLAFLVWANSYDARGANDGPVWWDAELAVRGGARPGDGTTHDVVVDGAPAWCDGGPRGPVAGLPAGPGGAPVRLLHRETIRLRRRDPARFPLRVLGGAAPTDALAADQLDAVAHAAGPARVIAPAGSGKTRVLTARLRHLLRDRHLEPSLVTAVAYNTRAAQEMRNRLADPDSTTGTGVRPNVRTLHSLGLWVCNLEQRRSLIDEREQRAILDRLVRTAKIPNQDPFQPYLDALGEVRLGLRHPDTVGVEYELDDFADTFRRYRAELDRRDAMDFDEQIFHAIELLLTNPDLRAHVQQVGTHLLVDEFQDLTPAFHLLVRLVASPSLQVFAVGDDDQVIYGYAGADPGYLIDYAAEFPAAVTHPLEVNYRCPPEVVGQVTRVLAHNRRRVDKVIRAGRTAAAPTTTPDRWEAGVTVHGVDAGAMAARTVATIQDRLDAGAHPHDVAVLARVNATLLPVQVALGEAGIPRTAPLDANVVGRTGVRTALAYLRLGLDPERMRREDVFDTLNRPSRKVKSAVAELLRGPRFSMDQLRQVEHSLSATHADRWRGYLDDLQVLTDAITDGADAERVLWLIRHRVGLGEAMDTLDSAKSRPEGSSHGDDLDALAQLAALHPDPVTFREWLVEALRRPSDEGGVTLSTVHRVKGMEWDHVVVFAANHGLMPHRLAEDDEEERRVFHVAVTRCRETVTVVGDRTATSPFVDELRHEPPERRPSQRTTTPTDDTARPPRPGADGVPVVAAVPGVRLTAPGGVPATVVRSDRSGSQHGLLVEVGGAWAPLALDAPVAVDGQRVRLELQATRVAPPATGRAGANGSGRLLAGGDDQLEGDDAVRFEALRTWRTSQAREQQVPPYIVFNDTHLREIARRAPASLVDLSRCPGVGPSKLDRYGDEVLQVIADAQ